MIIYKILFDSSFILSGSSRIAHIFYIVIATTLVLEYSFCLLQKSGKTSAKIAKLVASEYVTSQTPLTIKKVVEQLPYQYHDEDGWDQELCKMIVDRILQMRISPGVQK